MVAVNVVTIVLLRRGPSLQQVEFIGAIDCALSGDGRGLTGERPDCYCNCGKFAST